MDAKTLTDYSTRIVIVVIPLIWKATATWHSRKKTGKRLHYVIWKAERATWLRPKLHHLAASIWSLIRRKKPRTPSNQEVIIEPLVEKHYAELFLWNAGAEDITEGDTFDDHPLYIDLKGGEIESFKIKIANHDLILKGWNLIKHTPENPLIRSSTKVLATKVKYWPPASGVVIELIFTASSLRTASFSVCGPMRNLRERKFLGTLWRIDLNQANQLQKQLAWANIGSWLSGLFFASILAVFFINIRKFTIGTWQYWLIAAMLLTAECLYFIANDKYKQINKKVCPSLRYWLTRSE
jgi:hypothetical protein